MSHPSDAPVAPLPTLPQWLRLALEDCRSPERPVIHPTPPHETHDLLYDIWGDGVAKRHRGGRRSG